MSEEELETADDGGAEDTSVQHTEETGSRSDGRPERRSLREELEHSFNEARRAERAEEKRDEHGRFLKGTKPPLKKAQAQPAKTEQPEAVEQTADQTTHEATEQAEASQADNTASQPPVGWPKEAKAEWQSLSPTIQAAVLKREQDTQKGVDELKQKYADIEKSLSPHLEAIRRHGHTPGQAIGQLFSWFQALAQNPKEAFPALAKSFGYELSQFATPAGTSSPAQATAVSETDTTGQQVQDASQSVPEQALPPAVRQELDNLRQQVSGLASSWQQQTEAQTQQILEAWAKDKEFFPMVRGEMARLIQTGIIPLKDGRVDLDGAYERAIWSDPEVRNKLIAKQTAEREAAIEAQLEKKQRAQQEAANKARRAAVSLVPAAPSAAAGKGQPKKGKSVRESLREAIEEMQSA